MILLKYLLKKIKMLENGKL